jgi:hypothetical protein
MKTPPLLLAAALPRSAGFQPAVSQASSLQLRQFSIFNSQLSS